MFPKYLYRNANSILLNKEDFDIVFAAKRDHLCFQLVDFYEFILPECEKAV